MTKLPFEIEAMQKVGREAGLNAVKQLKDKGIPVYGIENGQIVAEYPDGTVKPLHGSVQSYDQPTEPVADDDWEANKPSRA